LLKCTVNRTVSTYTAVQSIDFGAYLARKARSVQQAPQLITMRYLDHNSQTASIIAIKYAVYLAAYQLRDVDYSLPWWYRAV